MYRKQCSLALLGGAISVLPLFLPLGARLTAYVKAEQQKVQIQLDAHMVEESESLKRLRIKERETTSTALAQSGVMPISQRLRITNYLDNNRDPRPDTTLYQEGETVTVYDAAGRCIGEIADSVWKWKRTPAYGDICQGVEAIKGVSTRRKE
ncbi:hypothetical protein NIES37_45040 [Tolypothrix tenuis PCC 7101]|uniref:Uncharacterized protein n=1 Tax=Tolypothrix tenuis PCC 7101 TaxID=231146 RepID=A0A1Z4N4D2_9CYAN|nr:hypothetical protein [Aulosira sp. FACHB-113]BAZ00512.1 hypothetical protein NIES37_45040 [Tolypothrix tenuis PCC 7101]BAZ75566.1 hypothetical protein NIES50_41540 [Aulosira laxa NIES-50]